MEILLKIPFSLIIEWMCFIASILFINNATQPKYWKLFPIYLGIMVLVETYCHYIGRIAFAYKGNHAIYNGFFLIYYSFHLYIFSKIINLKNIRIICAILSLILLVSYLSEWMHQGYFFLFYRTNTIFSGILVLLCILYYISLFKQDEYHDLLKDVSFWFATGCLIFYATNVAVNAFFLELVRTKIKGQVSIRYVIMAILNIIMYSCWIKSFLCLRNKQIYTRA